MAQSLSASQSYSRHFWLSLGRLAWAAGGDEEDPVHGLVVSCKIRRKRMLQSYPGDIDALAQPCA
jgi:hypothetical protein